MLPSSPRAALRASTAISRGDSRSSAPAAPPPPRLNTTRGPPCDPPCHRYCHIQHKRTAIRYRQLTSRTECVPETPTNFRRVSPKTSAERSQHGLPGARDIPHSGRGRAHTIQHQPGPPALYHGKNSGGQIQLTDLRSMYVP